MTLARRLRKNPGDPYWKSVSLLLYGKGADASTTITDSSPVGSTITASDGAEIDTAQSKFDGSSILFDGTDGRLSVPNSSAIQMDGGDFTIEWWMRAASLPFLNQLFNTSSGPTASANQSYALITFGTGLRYYLSSNGTSWNIASGVSMGSAISTGVWYHVALVRSGSTFTPYLNGVAGTTASSASSLYAFSSPLLIGAASSLNDDYSGHMQGVRITKGFARYTANFTPPSRPFPGH